MQAGKFVSASEIEEQPKEGLFPCYGGNGLRGYTQSFNQNGKYSLIGRQGALCGNVTLAEGKFYATEHAVVVTPSGGVDTVWLFYLLTCLNLNRFATGMAQPGLSIQNLEKVETTIPKSMQEQQKVASFLRLIDSRIQTQNKIIKGIKLLKSKLSKSILSQQLRFKDGSKQFPKWNNKKLGEICVIIGGGTPQTSNEKYWNGNIQWFTPTEIKGNSVHKSERTITHLGLKNSSAKILPKGAVLLTTRATIGEVAIAKMECTTNQGFQSLVVKENINNIFVFNWIKENKNELIKRAKGSTFPEISKSDLSNITIFVPCLSEQNKIANCLSSIDDRIEIEQAILDRWLLQKKILISNLFI